MMATEGCGEQTTKCTDMKAFYGHITVIPYSLYYTFGCVLHVFHFGKNCVSARMFTFLFNIECLKNAIK